MVSYLVVSIVSLAMGALGLNQWSRRRHGKSYNKWIKDDFDLQWRIIRETTLAHFESPFSKTIAEISPQFCTIFNQAWVAEKAPLLEVCGIAYGKALEFLIKDYAKRENPGLDTEIETAPLQGCVKKYIKDELLKNCAELATWLRNDETHYRRKHENKSVQDLKHLIVLVVQLIEESQRRKTFEQQITVARNEMDPPNTT